MEHAPASTPTASTGVVLVAHTRVDLAARCVATVPAELPRECVVVVVNDPAALDARVLERLRRRATVVSPPARQGYGANLNLGVASLPQGLEYLVLANDDVEFPDGAISSLLDTLRHDPRVGVVGPALRHLHGKQAPLQPQFPTALRAALNMTVLPLGPAWAPLSLRAGITPPDDPIERARNGWVIGAAMAVRVEAFRAVGGFDEDFFLYYEETDFCFRVREAGWRMAWRPDVAVRHVHAASTANSSLDRLFFQSERLYFRKRFGIVRTAALGWGLALLFGLSWLYNVLLAVARPASRHSRLELLRERWRTRIFLRGAYRRPA